MNLAALRGYAASVDADWPVTHGLFVHAGVVWEAPCSGWRGDTPQKLQGAIWMNTYNDHFAAAGKLAC